jgi:predicted kinase
MTGTDPAHRPGAAHLAGPVRPAPPDRPRRPAVLIGGAAGTGKSTLAAALAPRLGAALLDLDVATGPLTEVIARLTGRSDLSDPQLAALTRTPRYATLLALAADNLRAGRPVVLVAPFTAERTPRGWATVTARLAAAAPVLVWLRLAPDRLVARLRSRAATRDAGKISDPAKFLSTVDPEPPAVPHLALDAARPTADLVADVLAHLAHPGFAIDGKA